MKVYVCDNCGACCRYSLIEVDCYDVLREPRIAEGKLPSISLPVLEQTWLMSDGLGCRFLGDDNLCGIYATRPTVCVNFQAGSEKCQQRRTRAGLSPLQKQDVPDSVSARINVEATE